MDSRYRNPALLLAGLLLLAGEMRIAARGAGRSRAAVGTVCRGSCRCKGGTVPAKPGPPFTPAGAAAQCVQEEFPKSSGCAKCSADSSRCEECLQDSSAWVLKGDGSCVQVGGAAAAAA